MALRRDSPPSSMEVQALLRAIESGEAILTTGIVLQELLQGFWGRERVNRSWIDSPPYRCWFPIATITSGRRSCEIAAGGSGYKSERSMLSWPRFASAMN
jgi:hypothetical protein